MPRLMTISRKVGAVDLNNSDFLQESYFRKKVNPNDHQHMKILLLEIETEKQSTLLTYTF